MDESDNRPYALQTVIVKKTVPKDKALEHAENIIKKKAFKGSETKLTYRFRAIPKTKFIKESFRSKKINPDITLVFAELKPEFSKLMGRGFFDYFKKGYESAKETLGKLVDTTTDYFKPRLDSYDNKTTSMLKQIGDLPITRLQIYKAPLREMFNKALDLISLGAWSKSKKKYGFDTFFHLGLLATLDNGQTYIIEKLDRPSVSQDFNLNEQGLELLDVPLTGLGSKRLTINMMLEDARKAVGDQKFFEYDSFRNNCQFFVRMLLDNQGLYTEREKNFFFQDISQLVNELPEYVQNFQRFATDTTATVGKITGQGINEPRRQPIYKGRGIEDFVKDKGLELASGFADSIGGENFLGQVQEDITDIFSGRRIGDSQRQRTADREAQQKADQLEYEEKQREYRKTKEFQAETYARDIGGKFYEEIWPKWEKKFMTPTEGYLLYPEDVVHFGNKVREKGLRSKAEVDKFFAKTKKDALQMLKTGKPVGDIKYDSEMLRKYQSQLRGSGIEDFVKEKGLELASGFADSIGGENFLGRVGEDITDMFSGREIGYTERKRQEDRRAEEQAVRDEGEKKEADYRKKNPDKFSAETYAREIGWKLYEEIWPKWEKKFATDDGYLLNAEDVSSFGNAVRREGLRSKAEVDKLYKKTRKDALQTLKTGEPPANAVGIKDNRESLREYWEAKARREGSGNPFVDLGNRAVASTGGAGIGFNQPNPYGNLRELEQQFGRGLLGYIDELEGGNQASGFIRAMMARRFPQGQRGNIEDNTDYKEINKKKFKNFDNAGFDIKKMSKTTHNLALTSKPLTKDEIYRSFYDYIVQHAPQHLPVRDGGINYKGTYDMVDRLFDLWKETIGTEKRQERKRRKDTQPEDVDIPASFYDLPKPKEVVNSPAVVVVPVEDVDDEKGDKVVLGEFEDPKTTFEREINKLVNYGATYLHFDDFIANVLQPVSNPRMHSAFPFGMDAISTYYLITKYKIPILEFGTNNIFIPKDINTKPKLRKDTLQKQVSLYNNIGYVSDIKDIPKITEKIKEALDKGAPQVLLRMGMGLKGFGYHANAIIVRAVDKKIYIVDPHGEQEIEKYKAQYKKQLSIITKIAKELKYTVVPSGESCPYPSLRGNVKKGFQSIEGLLGRKMGFCGWWSYFIIEMCCLKPDVPFEDLYAEARTLLSDSPEKIFNVIVKYQYNLQQIAIKIAKEEGIDITDKVPTENIYNVIGANVSDKIGDLLIKRKDLLGYGELEGDGSRGYNFIRALNASKAPANTESESIVKWREEHKEDADKINEGKFGKFDYSKVKKGTRDLAKRTKNVDPKKFHPPADKSGLYDLKKNRKGLQYKDNESTRDRGMYHRFSLALKDWRGYYLENWSDLSQTRRKGAYRELAELINAKKDPTYLGKVVLDELKTVDDFDEFDFRDLPDNILRAFYKWLNKQ
jgi:hypothetical protein